MRTRCLPLGFSLLLALAMVQTTVALAAPSLTSPASATAGAKVTVQVTGSGNPRDFVTIVPKGAPEGQYFDYFYVENREKVLEMPSRPGDYEIRLLAADSPYKTLLSRPIKVAAASATVKGPATAAAGSDMTVTWTGPNNERDFVGLGKPGSNSYLNYKYTRDGSPMELDVPEEQGTYEIRYFLGADNAIIARQDLAPPKFTSRIAAVTTLR